jgi:hypothetical protein
MILLQGPYTTVHKKRKNYKPVPKDHEDAAVAVDFVSRLALGSSAESDRLRRIGEPLMDDGSDELKPYASAEAWKGRGWYARQLDIVLTGTAALRVT